MITRNGSLFTYLERGEEVPVIVPGRELLASRLSLGVVGGRLGSLQHAHELLEAQRSCLAGHLNSEVHRQWPPQRGTRSSPKAGYDMCDGNESILYPMSLN